MYKIFLNLTQRVFSSTLDLFFPNYCLSCSEILDSHDSMICRQCQIKLPYVSNGNSDSSQVLSHFTGRLELKYATALLYFSKQSIVQNLLHALKYRKCLVVADILGGIMAQRLQKLPLDLPYNAVVPIPLHPSKLKIRGYNQAELYARALSKYLSIPLLENSLIRVKNNQTQTNKSRIERRVNTDKIFAVTNGAELNGKHVLLVDDVLTTGATIESAGQAILEHSPLALSVHVMAVVV